MVLLTPKQAEILLTRWTAEQPLKRSELQERMTEREWKTPTLNGFLAKLVDMGFLEIEHQRRDYVYHPLISKEEYLEFETNTRTKKFYGDFATGLLAAFTSHKPITKEQIEEVEQYLNHLKEEYGKGE